MWRVTGASLTGPQHDHNQDRWGWATTDAGIVAVVADGAGSALHAAEGAHQAVIAALGRAIEAANAGASPKETCRAGVQAAVSALDGRRDHACTITVAAVGDETLAVAAIGDSPAFVAFQDGHVEHWESNKESEFINETVFVTSPSAEMSQWDCALSGVEMFVLGSDGLTPCVSDAGEPTAGFFSPLRQRAKAEDFDPAALLEHMSSLHLLGDDTTLLVAAWSV